MLRVYNTFFVNEPTYLTRSDTCFMKAEIAATSGNILSVDLSSSFGDAALDFMSTTGTEFEDFSAATLKFTKFI